MQKLTLGLLGLVLALFSGGACAMNLNLAMPWGEKCSPPLKPELTFVSPQSEEMLFTTHKEIVIDCLVGLRSVGLSWTLARNVFTTPFREGAAEALPANRYRIRLPVAGLHPGFYDLRVKLDVGLPKPVEGICTFGYRVTKMPIRDSRPADFAQFWRDAKATLVHIPLDAHEGPVTAYTKAEIDAYNVKSACLPADYDPTGHQCDTVESCKVDFAGPDGGRVYGWLAKPAAPGKYPAMLVLPGAGFAARPRPLEHARHGYVSLDIQVHGQDVDLPTYDPIPGYSSECVYEPSSAYYYYNVHLRCVQAVTYLASRPDVDPTRIVVVGGSQGGRLSVVVAGLDPRVKAAVPCITNMPNQPYLMWAAACNQAHQDGMDTAMPPALPATLANRTLAYYDPMNYAPDIRCPVFFNAGLIDPISPPISVFGVYNRLGTKDTQIAVLPGMAHDWSAEFDRRAWRWLDTVLAPRSGKR